MIIKSGNSEPVAEKSENISHLILFFCFLHCVYYSSMARNVEEIVRTHGSVPATVGILNGKIHIGLNDEELHFLAKSENLVKVSRRDLPYVLSQVLYIDLE